MNNTIHQVELFHLLFLEQLTRQLDHKLYAVKGGCNLRFFFKSFRYSEDLDIDVQTIAVTTLKNKIDRILSSHDFKQILKSRNIIIDKFSSPKQSQTTQRWKLILKTKDPLPVNTKIEFSRHKKLQHAVLEPINPEIIAAHNLLPFVCSHHKKLEAIAQKISALAGRSYTQTRDVFDLYLLTQSIDSNISSASIDTQLIEQAQEKALSLSFNDYKSQVIAYLHPDHQQQYGNESIWNQIINCVIETLDNYNNEIN